MEKIWIDIDQVRKDKILAQMIVTHCDEVVLLAQELERIRASATGGPQQSAEG
jgi:hypothetical protein